MTDARLLLMLGNGLTLDAQSAVDLKDISSSRPLDFRHKLMVPDQPTIPLMDKFTELGREIDEHLRAHPDADQFEIIRMIDELTQGYEDVGGMILVSDGAVSRRHEAYGSVVLQQLRHFMVLSYSWYQIQVEKRDLTRWQWTEWLGKWAGTIGLVVSFNYDCLFESAISYGTRLEPEFIIDEDFRIFGRVPIFKPHGSINYENESLQIGRRTGSIYDTRFVMDKADGLLSIVPWPRYRPSKNSSIVLPCSYSHMSEYIFNRPGLKYLLSEGHTFTHCVIAGLSYWKYDRNEIDRMLGCLPQSTKIIVINPHPPDDLMRMLRQRFADIRCQASGAPDPALLSA